MKKTRPRIIVSSGNLFLDLGFPPHEATVLLRCRHRMTRVYLSR
jgi:hypothetical protein